MIAGFTGVFLRVAGRWDQQPQRLSSFIPQNVFALDQGPRAPRWQVMSQRLRASRKARSNDSPNTSGPGLAKTAPEPKHRSAEQLPGEAEHITTLIGQVRRSYLRICIESFAAMMSWARTVKPLRSFDQNKKQRIAHSVARVDRRGTP